MEYPGKLFYFFLAKYLRDSKRTCIFVLSIKQKKKTMKYQLVSQGTKNAMRLQSIGLVQGEPAENIVEGSFLMWNFGSVYVVNEILKETAKTITISTSPKNDSSKVYEQRLNKSRLVCILK